MEFRQRINRAKKMNVVSVGAEYGFAAPPNMINGVDRPDDQSDDVVRELMALPGVRRLRRTGRSEYFRCNSLL